MSENQFLLEMLDIEKQFPGVKALDHAKLQLRPGTVHALMGENGAGKSTLMKCMFGIYKMNEGEIYYDEELYEIEISAVDTSRPAIVRSGTTYTQRGYTIFKVELVYHLLEDGLITSQFKLTTGNIGSTGLESQNQFSIFFVTDTYINILHQIGHNLLCLLGGPQLLTEV